MTGEGPAVRRTKRPAARTSGLRGRLALLALAAAIALLGRAWPARAQEPDEAFLDRVVASLTVDERIGQLVMVNFIADDAGPESDIAALIRDFKVGSVLVTASNGNVVNRDDTAGQLATLTGALQQRAYEANRRTDNGQEYFLPLLVATDNEGDLFPFSNVTHDYTQIPNNMTIGATWSKQHAEAVGGVVGRELSAAGINLLLGPVVDVLDNPRSGGGGDIGIRSFGGNAAWAGALGRAYVRGVHQGSGGRMLTVAKHFPGHGGSDRSTDNEVPTVNKSLTQLRDAELAPFAELNRIDDADPLGTTDAMMVSHIRYRNFVPGSTAPFTRPISIDGPAFRTLMDLPEFSTWRPDHLVMADALGVSAIKQWYAREEGQPEFPSRSVVRQALLAGNDLLPLIEFYLDPAERGWKEYQLPLIQDAILYMREQYATDQEFRLRADEAVRHVVAAKMRLYPQLRLADVLVDPAAAAEAAGSGAEEMQALAEAALTLLQPLTVDELRARMPRGPLDPDRVLIVECWSDCYPYRVMPRLQLQEHLLQLYGPDGAGRIKPEGVSTISFGELDSWLSQPGDPGNQATGDAVRDATWIIFALTEYNPVARPASGAVKRFLNEPSVDLRNKYLVGIAYNVPYHLDSTEISKLSAYLAVYNKTDPAIDAGFRALFGDLTPRGHAPVNVSGVFYEVATATRPDPAREIALTVFGHDAQEVPAGPKVGLVAGPILDRNGNPVPDGTTVSFSMAKAGGATRLASGRTVDGIAGAQVEASGAGEYTASASVAGVTSQPLSVTLTSDAPVSTPDAGAPATDASSGGGTGALVLALAIGVPSALAVAAVAGGGVVLYRRRASARASMAGVAEAAAPEQAVTSGAVPGEPPVLRVDADTRRVYVKGAEAKPPLSNEQFRLLLYLYERSGKVVAREDLIRHVWPDAHAEGVSEEALDALVRRVRERIVQAGGERSYIVTLRGQGFRLEV